MDDPRIGTVLEGRYEIQARIAAGGMGLVYRAERIKLGRAVAIKFLHPWSAGDESLRKRFEVEAIAMARLNHPNCAAVIDFGVEDGAPFVVMDYVPGVNLRELLDAGPMTIDEAAEIMRQILSGLRGAHELGIVHRDIKPANIMVHDPPGAGVQVKILDFGLAHWQERSGDLTAGVAIGTPSYMAPEQCQAGEIDSRTDLYACGVLLFEMLAGERPFWSDDTIELLRMHEEEPPPRLADERPDVDFGALEDVVARALAKDPAARFQSAAEMAAALENAVGVRAAGTGPHAAMAVSLPMTPAGGTPPLARDATPAPPAPMQRPVRWILGGTVAIALLGLFVAVIAAGDEGAAGEPEPAPIAFEPDDLASADRPEVLRAKELIAAGELDQAVDLLQALRTVHAGDAEIAYMLGRLYFQRMWWNDGLDAFRAATRLDPQLRTHPPLIKEVLRGFIITPRYHSGLGRFLREDIGEAAIPYLEETARDHPRPKVRARAERELRRLRAGSR